MQYRHWSPLMLMRSTTVLIGLAALAMSGARAMAQLPGSAMGGRQGMGMNPNGIPQNEPLPPRPDAGPKSEELVDIRPLLRGVKLDPAQDSAVKAINERFEPQLLPMYDWLRVQKERRQRGQDVDMALVQRRFDRVTTLRQQQLTEIRAVLNPVQIERFERNAEEDRKRAAEAGPAKARP